VAQRIVAFAARRRASEGKSSISKRPSLAAKEINVKLVYSRCAGLDVHKKTISVCVRQGNGKKLKCTNDLFGTFTADLERLCEFLLRHKVHRVVMESTGVYWIPVWNVLERARRSFDLVLVNPQHVRALPGRKTDQKDCERLAELGQYDLLRCSFIPPPPIRELRDLTRLRAHLQGDRNRLVNRIGRLLETGQPQVEFGGHRHSWQDRLADPECACFRQH
jgi:transposase